MTSVSRPFNVIALSVSVGVVVFVYLICNSVIGIINIL